MPRVLVLFGVSLLLLAGTRTDLGAQYRYADTSGWTWPASFSPTVLPLIGLSQQEQRLPVYDANGAVIPFDLIQARVDDSGLNGAFWVGLLFSAGGALMGAALSASDCNETRGGYRYYCSPREDAMRGALTGGLPATLGILGMWLGWNDDVTTWQEAVNEIREERRLGASR